MFQSLRKVISGCAAVVLFAMPSTSLAVPTFSNAGFEDTVTSVGGFGPFYSDIPVWTDPADFPTGVDGPGVPTAGPGIWLNGIPAPEGSQIAFIQGAGSFSQSVTGLTAGKAYTVSYRENERAFAVTDFAMPSVTLGGTTVVAAHANARTQAFRRVVGTPFTATSSSHLLTFTENGGSATGETSLFDDVIVTRAVPVVGNGGFEAAFTDTVDPVLGSEYAPTDPGTVWTFSPLGGVARYSGPFSAGDAPNEGQQHGFLQGISSLEQTIGGFEVGATYSLTWDYRTRTDFVGDNSLIVELIGGETIELFNSLVTDTTWQTITSAPFVAASSSYTLRARTTLAGDNSTLVDDFHFNFVAEAPAPEPSSILLAALALMGFVGSRRRRRR